MPLLTSSAHTLHHGRSRHVPGDVGNYVHGFGVNAHMPRTLDLNIKHDLKTKRAQLNILKPLHHFMHIASLSRLLAVLLTTILSCTVVRCPFCSRCSAVDILVSIFRPACCQHTTSAHSSDTGSGQPKRRRDACWQIHEIVCHRTRCLNVEAIPLIQ